MNCGIKVIDILKLETEYSNNLRLWRNQDFVRNNMFNKEIISEVEHRNFVADLKTRTDKKVFIVFRGDIPFGVLNYTVFEKENSLEFGYYLINESDINSGFGIILEYILLEYSFHYLEVSKVFCRTLTLNNKVVNLHKKFGFDIEDLQTKHICIEGTWQDVCIQSIMRDRWQKQKEKVKPLVEFFCPINSINFED